MTYFEKLLFVAEVTFKLLVVNPLLSADIWMFTDDIKN